MSSVVKDVLRLSDNEDTGAQKCSSGASCRGVKKIGSSVSHKVADKSKRKKTTEVPDDCCLSGSGTGDNSPCSEELTPLTTRDLPTIVAAVVRFLRAENLHNAEDEEQTDPPYQLRKQ